ncbi:PAP/fibrillin family protein [Nostoc sp. FACHB-280]|uniref:PAP/fibrillin family protein n=1 Tax=Nostoc sp. FACHB-280 TaxID=2692839 RepID=UPI00168B7DE2|nr:PAP/fibrillin family protein [Nostoc sp. FACHB-280]MBD2496713.1 PAP fibrillin [Nostoc sp. FACHB-280]
MIDDNVARLGLKHELLSQIGALSLQQALFPLKQESIDTIVQQLEKINPLVNPLNISNLSCLSGNWQLIYASNGTVVTRPLASISDFFGAIKIKRVWQNLLVQEPGKIAAINAAEFELFLVGQLQLSVDGVWKWEQDEQVAKVSFDAFSWRATKLLGISTQNFPVLTLPILEFWRNEALWRTSYLDSDIRIGRGVTGNLFVFQREESANFIGQI